jgi:predicted Zn-dependent protease
MPKALAEYKKVLELKPGLYEAELNLGILLIRDKQAGRCGQILQQAVEQKPKEFRPMLYWAEALLDRATPPRPRSNTAPRWS